VFVLNDERKGACFYGVYLLIDDFANSYFYCYVELFRAWLRCIAIEEDQWLIGWSYNKE